MWLSTPRISSCLVSCLPGTGLCRSSVLMRATASHSRLCARSNSSITPRQERFVTSDQSGTVVLSTTLPVFLCPSDPNQDNWTIVHATGLHALAKVASANYIGIYGIHDFACGVGFQCKDTGPLYQNSSVRIGDIRDGTSNTVIVTERRNDALNVWVAVTFVKS